MRVPDLNDINRRSFIFRGAAAVTVAGVSGSYACSCLRGDLKSDINQRMLNGPVDEPEHLITPAKFCIFFVHQRNGFHDIFYVFFAGGGAPNENYEIA